MRLLLSALSLLLLTFAAASAQTNVGAFFAFQDAASQSATNGSGTYDTKVSVNTLTGTPTFSGTGLTSGGYGNYASPFTAFNGSVWTAARGAGWNAKDVSAGTFQVTLNTAGVTNLAAHFNYRLNGLQSGGTNVTALAAFEYKIGGGAWVAVPGVSLTLVNSSSYNNNWTANLSAVTALNNQPEINLRWSLPPFTQTTNNLLVRIDNLQITGTSAAPSANLVWQTAAQLPQARVGSAYEHTVAVSEGTAPYTYQVKAGSAVPTGLSLSSGGVLSGMPTILGNYSFTIVAMDAGSPAKTSERAFSMKVADAGVTRVRVLPVGNYNVLFVAFDDLKANFGSFFTPEQAATMPKAITPNLDSLASSGMAFTRAYVQHPVCWGSRASLMTGCRPDTTKIWDQIETAVNQANLNFRTTMPGIVTLPQHFAGHGYNVAGHGKIYDQRGTPPSYDASLSWPGGMDTSSFAGRYFYQDGHFQAENAAAAGKSKLFATDKGEFKDPTATPKVPINKDTDYADGIMTTKAIAKLNAYAQDYTANGKPFFLAVGYQKPHLPFNAPKQFWDLYDPDEINLTGYTGTRTFPTGTLPFTGANYEINTYGDIGANTVTDPSKARNLIHGYLAATSFADDQLGRVLAALRANPAVAANTIICVWGDHGWHLGDHDGFWAKHTCYEEAARAPLIICAPGMDALGKAGKACQSPVEFVDIYPTLVDLAGLPPPAQPAGLEFQGTSLRALLEDPDQAWKKAAFTQYQRFINGTDIANSGEGMGYSIRTQCYRYTEWWRTQTTKDQTAGNYSITRDVKLFPAPECKELYDMDHDPNQTVNLAAHPAYADVVAELSVALAGGYGWDTDAVAAPSTYPTDYPSWQKAYTTPGVPSSLLDPLLDPDKDGMPNVAEYVYGTGPLVPGAEPLWSGSAADGFTLEYPRVVSRDDVATVVERSSNLADWTTNSVTNQVVEQVGYKTIYQSFSTATNGTNAPTAEFLHLRFTK